jgi:integration host factor subunit alpha
MIFIPGLRADTFFIRRGTMALTKNDIVASVHELGFTKKKSVEIIESLLEIIKIALETSEDVLISGFGKFCVKQKGQRRGRNPATGEDLILRARKVVTFKCSGKLRNKINGIEYSE